MTNGDTATWLLIGLLAGCVAVMSATAAQPQYWSFFVAAAFGAGALLVPIRRRATVTVRTVLLLAIVFRLALIWLPPVLSDDAFRYVWDGWMQLEGIDPYRYVPADAELAAYHDEPLYDRLNSPEYYSVYPPVSQLIFRIGGLFYEQGWQASYFVIKVIMASFEVGAVIVLSRMISPGNLLLYAWNPLVLIAGAGQAHGEAVLAFFLSLTLWSSWKGRGGAAGVWLACAGWVKLYPFVLIPLLWRRFGWRSIVTGTVAAVLLGAPYAHAHVVENVMRSLDLYVRLFEFNAGFYYVVKGAFELVTGADWSKQIGPALRFVFIGALPLIYMLDARHRWPLQRAFAVTIGGFLILSTTVHPWYLVGILAVVAPAAGVAWHWYWLSIVSIGTYLLYVDGPYWPWVIVGWLGWLALALNRHGRAALDALMRSRAREKADLVAPFLSRGDRILDLGAAEGFVAERLVQTCGVEARLVDVIDLNRSELPHLVYDGRRLPFEDDRFDVAVLVYVLHHAMDPRQVLREALRVASRRVIILESTYVRRWEHKMLRLIDHSANLVRSLGRMERETLHFRTFQEWLDFFDNLNVRVAARRDLGGFIHHRALYVLDATSWSQDTT